MCFVSMTNIDPNWTALVADKDRADPEGKSSFQEMGFWQLSRNFIFNVMEIWKFFLPRLEGESLLKSPKPAKQWVKDRIKLDGA